MLNLSDSCCTVAATLAYGLAALRDLARKGLLPEGDSCAKERLLNLPITIDDVLNVAEANKDSLAESSREGDNEMYGTALLSLKSNLHSSEGMASEDLTSQLQLVACDDENSRNELVYGIAINQ